MESVVIIIIGIVFALISALGKKKPNKSAENEPPRPTLSDIQRAFMMSGEMEAAKRAPEARQAPFYSPPAAKPPEPRSEVSPRMAESVSAFQPANRYASIDLSTFHTDSEETSTVPKKQVKYQKSSLKLFENKSDFVRAVIYSEILTRKAHR